tara:strand:- start:1649 stop:2311 length:663 start_codon:yes stop_codon:yes gene_type:complete
MRNLWNIPLFTVVFAALTLVSGCAGSQGPELVVVPQDRYSEAFDAAVAVARENGLRPSFMDRRSGVIETEPAMAASLMEPWKGGNADFNQALRNTLSRNRLRARFEFSRAGFAARSDSDEIPPVDLLAMTESDWDLTREDGPLDLKVWVFEERGHSVGQRRNRWTFSGSSYTYHQPVEGQWSESPVSFWTPTTRDRAAEKRILAEVETMLNPKDASQTLN